MPSAFLILIIQDRFRFMLLTCVVLGKCITQLQKFSSETFGCIVLFYVEAYQFLNIWFF